MTSLTKFIKGLNICLNYIVNETDTTKGGIHYIRMEENNPFTKEEKEYLKALGFKHVINKGILYFKEN